MRTIGFMGAGNMGSAILRGGVSTGYINPAQLCVCDVNNARLLELQTEFPEMVVAENIAELAACCDVIVLAVKPYQLGDVLAEAEGFLDGKLLISIAAGWTMAMLDRALEGSGATWIRVMPNTPALVGEGMTAICKENNLSESDFAYVKGLFDEIGRTAVLPEKQFDGAIAISGSSPAYVFMLIEAMADAGVREGLQRTTAYEMAAQSVLGAALMVLTTGTHPGELKDNVCSPGGTTIEAVSVLEKEGFRSAVMEAMKTCADKSRKMSE